MRPFPPRRALLLAAAVCLAASVASPSGGAERDVSMTEATFEPSVRRIVVDDSVLWHNESTVGHTVTSYPGAPESFDSSPRTRRTAEGGSCDVGPLDPASDCIQPGDDEPNISFEKPGRYAYYCKIHGNPSVRPNPKLDAGDAQPCGMCGVIDVKKPRGATPSPRRDRADETVLPTVRPTETPSATASPSPTGEPTETTDEDPLAAGETDGGGSSRTPIAVAAILALAGAGYLTWRKFLAT